MLDSAYLREALPHEGSLLGRPDGGEHDGAGVQRQLDGRLAHAARARVDQHRVAALHAADLVQGVQRLHTRPPAYLLTTWHNWSFVASLPAISEDRENRLYIP